jgi:3-oxoacyl-[acyl-carrier protein] reductase
MKLLKGKTAIITGASKGIGRATALRLARSGVHIVAVATNEGLLHSLEDEIKATGLEAAIAVCDIVDFEACERVVQEAVDRFQVLDILVNNAGVGYSGAIIDSDPGEAARMVNVNILGVYHMSRCVLPHMVEKKGGDVVNIGSVAGLKYSPNFAVYSATKFAVRAFSEAMRNEVQAHNIRVTLVNPGMTRTPFFDSFTKGGSPVPLDKGDVLKPEHIAEAIHFALCRPAGVALNEVTVRPDWQER